MESTLPLSLKLIIFTLVAVGDVLAALIIGSRLMSRGQGLQALIICAAMIMGIVVMGVVLFVVL